MWDEKSTMQQVYEFVVRSGRIVQTREIVAAIGAQSVSSVTFALTRLVREGNLERTGYARTGSGRRLPRQRATDWNRCMPIRGCDASLRRSAPSSSSRISRSSITSCSRLCDLHPIFSAVVPTKAASGLCLGAHLHIFGPSAIGCFAPLHCARMR